MQRLVTIEDLQKYPELYKQGVSINQHFDIDAYSKLINGTPPIAKIKPDPVKKEEPKKPTKKK